MQSLNANSQIALIESVGLTLFSKYDSYSKLIKVGEIETVSSL